MWVRRDLILLRGWMDVGSAPLRTNIRPSIGTLANREQAVVPAVANPSSKILIKGAVADLDIGPRVTGEREEPMTPGPYRNDDFGFRPHGGAIAKVRNSRMRILETYLVYARYMNILSWRYLGHG